jgi:hypothetical protein
VGAHGCHFRCFSPPIDRVFRFCRSRPHTRAASCRSRSPAHGIRVPADRA